MDMQDNTVDETEKNPVESHGIIDAMYEAVSAITERPLIYLCIYLFSFLIAGYSIYNSNLGDMASDAKVIEVAIVNVIGTILQSVLILNFFYFAFKKIEFKTSKVLWDIPTYVFFGFLFGTLTILGSFLFVIPGMYVFYMYMTLPIVSILFDEEEKSNFKITKEKVSNLGGTYAIYFVLSLIVSGVASVVSTYAPGTGLPMPLIYGACMILVFVQSILSGIIVSLLNKA